MEKSKMTKRETTLRTSFSYEVSEGLTLDGYYQNNADDGALVRVEVTLQDSAGRYAGSVSLRDGKVHVNDVDMDVTDVVAEALRDIVGEAAGKEDEA